MIRASKRAIGPKGTNTYLIFPTSGSRENWGTTFQGEKMFINSEGLMRWFKEDPFGDWLPYYYLGKIAVEFLHERKKGFIEKEEFDPELHAKQGSFIRL